MCSLVLRFTLRSFRLTATKQEAAEDANILITVLLLTSLFACTTCPTEAWSWWKFRWHAQVGIWWRNDRILPFEDVTWTLLCRKIVSIIIIIIPSDVAKSDQSPALLASVRKQPAAVVWRLPVRIGQRRPFDTMYSSIWGERNQSHKHFFLNL